ncbi:MAG TPA: type II toxin-antitoxin system HicB family antitoxin [Nitrososphaera sp.]|nr:type II toxin-antitoxin system HicB family antitoxin [Nitrososphaera sp.]
MLNVRQFTVRYWEEPEGGYGGQCIELPGAVSQGETLEELRANMEDAIRLSLEYVESKAKTDKHMIIELKQ